MTIETAISADLPAEDEEPEVLKPGTLGLYIVSEIFKHGALSLMELQEEIGEVIGYLPSEGALYGTASRLKADGLIESEKTEFVVKKHKVKVRVYKITEKGKAVLSKTKNTREEELYYLNGVFSENSDVSSCPA